MTSRKREVERLQTSDLARSNIQRPFIRFEMKRPSGRHVLECKEVNKGYGDLSVIKNFKASLQRGEKIALMGRNGVGKTTLLKALLANGPGVDDPDIGLDSGVVTWGHEAQIGYFAQDHRGSIRNGTTRSSRPLPIISISIRRPKPETSRAGSEQACRWRSRSRPNRNY